MPRNEDGEFELVLGNRQLLSVFFILVVLLHYSPIRATVEGEPLEIFPFLGSSRLEEPLGRFDVTVVFHGHAHHGALEGRTRGDVPVYNVCVPLLKAAWPDRPFRVVDLAAPEASGPPVAPAGANQP